MKYPPTDEHIEQRPEDQKDDVIELPAGDVEQPGIVAGVGSSALGSVNVEPQTERHPDNDGETVEEDK